MTANQINYFKAREDVRAHQAQEQIGAETNRINLIKSGIDAQNAATNQLLAQIRQFESVETARANQAREYETQRHNVAMENETMRANTAAESQRNLQLWETQRSNLAGEQLTRERQAEVYRSNVANEALESFRLNEMQRSNLVGETQKEAQLWHDARQMQLQSEKQAEEARHNLAVEQETQYRDYRSLNQGAFKEVTNFMGRLVSPVLGFLGA